MATATLPAFYEEDGKTKYVEVAPSEWVQFMRSSSDGVAWVSVDAVRPGPVETHPTLEAARAAEATRTKGTA